MNMLKRSLAVMLVLCMLIGMMPLSAMAAGSTAPADGTTAGEPFPMGTGGSNSFRIPSMVTLENGNIVAAADARWNTTYDGGGLDTIVAVSEDDGENWSYSFANYLGDNGNAYNGSGSTCFIDPALIADGNTVYMLVDLYPYGIALNGNGSQRAPSPDVGFNADGKLLLSADDHGSYGFYLDGNTIYASNGVAVEGYEVDEYFNITGNGRDTNLFFSDSPYKVVRTGFLYLTKSEDGGESWSAPTLLDLKTADEQVCLVGPGRGLKTSTGMLVFPVYSYNGNTDGQQIGFVYSEDNGVTWERSANSGVAWSSESAVVELNDGTLRFFYRCDNRVLSYVDYNVTTNTWGSEQMTAIPTNSNTQLSAITYSKTYNGQQVILVSCPTGPNRAGSSNNAGGADGERKNGEIFALAVDATTNAMTKIGSIVVNDGGAEFMYSCMTELNDGTVALLYEDHQNGWGAGDDKYYTMAYTEYDVAAVTGLTFDGDNAVKDVVLDMGDSQTFVDKSGSYADDYTGEGLNEDVATVEVSAHMTDRYSLGESVSALTSGEKYILVNNRSGKPVTNGSATQGNATGLLLNGAKEDAANAAIWTITGADGNYTVQDLSGNYMSVGADAAAIGSDPATLAIQRSGDNWTISNGSAYLNHFGGDSSTCAAGWNGAGASGDDGSKWTIYRVETDTVEDGTEVTITAMGPGNTEVTVGNTLYNITVGEVVDVVLGVGESKTYTDETGNYADSYTGAGLDETIATVTVTGKNAVAETVVSTDAASAVKDGATYIIRFHDTNKAITTRTGGTNWGTHTLASEDFSAADDENMWTLEAASDGKYKIKSAAGYLSLARNAATLGEDGQEFTLTSTADGWTIGSGTYYINNLGGTYNAGGWTTGGTKFDLYEVTTETPASTDVTITGVKPGRTSVIVGSTQYNITVTKEEYNISLVVDTIVAIDTPRGSGAVTVSNDAVLGAAFDSAGKLRIRGRALGTGDVETDYAIYHVTVTDGIPVTITVGGSAYLDMSTELTEGQYMTWTTADGTHVSTAPNYDRDGNPTNTGIIVGNAVTEENSPISVIGTIHNADGSIASTEKWLVTVTEGTTAHNNVETITMDIVKIQNCTIYYAVNGGNLVKITDDMLTGPYENDDGTEYYELTVPLYDKEVFHGGFHISFFADPDPGYALTFMSSTNSAGDYYCLSDGENPDGSDSSAWPFVEGYDYEGFDALTTKPGNNSGTYDTSVGMRWGLIEGNVTVAELKTMYTNALALGCDGVLVFTKNKTETYSTDLAFVSQKLPEMNKTISTVNDQPYTEGDKLVLGDRIGYDVVLYYPTIDTDYGNITYTNMELDDPLTNNNWATATGVPAGYKSSSTGMYTFVNSSTGEVLTQRATAYTYETNELVLSVTNFLELVDDHGNITNTAHLEYDYQSQYSNGKLSSSSSAVVAARVDVPEYVIDFGLPITVNLTNNPLIEGYESIVAAEAQYGTVTFDGLKVTYTPNTVLKNNDFIRLTIADRNDNTSNIGYGIRIYPATTVYYEESFFSAGWTQQGTPITAAQTTEQINIDPNSTATSDKGKQHNYGFDPVYNSIHDSGSYLTTSTIGQTISVNFTGTGIDLYANSLADTGHISVRIRNADTGKLYLVNTVAVVGGTDATTGQTVIRNAPVVSVRDLAHGDWEVIINKVMDENPVQIDGFRVYNTMKDSTIFTSDREDNPDFYELRDCVMDAVGVGDSEFYGDVETMANQIFNDTDDASALIFDESVDYADSSTIQDLLDNGPKNELFLFKGQTLVFKLTTNRDVQLGMKAPAGAARYSINGGEVKDLFTTVDMFYDLGVEPGTTQTHTFTIKNEGDAPLSVTLLKICDDPNFAFNDLTAEDIENALHEMGYADAETPADPTDAFYYDAYLWAKECGITTAETIEEFNPSGDLLRAQVVTMLWRYAGAPETASDNPFTDVSESDWYYDAVLWAVELGITNGVSATEFDPFGTTNRAQALTFLWRFLGHPDSETSNTFTDVEAGAWYEAAVNWAVEKGVTEGMTDGTFGVNINCNRAHMITFLYRTMFA